MLGTLDRYVLREWTKIFLATALGFPLIVIAIELTDKLDEYLARGLKPAVIAKSYVFAVPEKMFMVLPAAVLFATVFTVGALGRHSELTAAKATGRSFHRLVLPIILAGIVATGMAFFLGEAAPPATRHQLELLGEKALQNTTGNRYNFAYRADEGWVYTVRSLESDQRTMHDVLLEREGGGGEYPTLAIQAFAGRYADSLKRWTLFDGRFRVVQDGDDAGLTFAFDSLVPRTVKETPADLLAEPKAPEEMRYRELGRYIEAIERSGADAKKLKVDHALKIAIPVTCLIIAIFGAPLGITTPRASGAFGVAISLGTTLMFLTLIQLSRAVGSGGLVPPVVAAWIPNGMFGLAGLWLMARAKT